jgi:hypothetical protein
MMLREDRVRPSWVPWLGTVIGVIAVVLLIYVLLAS